MASNRLNLQIGGPAPDEYVRRKAERHMQRRLDEQVESVAEELISEQTFDELYEILDPNHEYVTEFVRLARR